MTCENPASTTCLQDHDLAMALAPDWYRAGSLRAVASLVAQGVDDAHLLRAWAAYGAAVPQQEPAAA